MATYSLTINGEKKTVEAAGDMPLLWVLRDLIGLTGSKYGCGMAQCRACTVLLDGVPSMTCLLPIESVGDRKITTIEGLTAMREPGQGSDAVLNAVQESWVQEDVPQCGYCQPGQILSAYSLLKRVAKPSDDDIDEAMNGNLCRCGTYNRIRKAVHRAAGSLSGAEGGKPGAKQ